MCDHQFKFSGYSNICERCGVEHTVCHLETISGFTMNQPLWVGYNRANRFRKMVLAVCRPLTHSKVPGQMVLYLNTKPKCDTMDELYENMKSAVCCSDKGYNSMHLYAIMYLKYYEPQRSPTNKMIGDVVGDFILIEQGHKFLFPKKRFFSYRWLLTTLLKHRQLDFWTRYVKPLRNNSSNRRYQKMYDQIMTVNKRVPTPDKVVKIGIQLVRPLGDEPKSPPESFESNPLKFAPPERIVGGLCPKQYDSPGIANPPASRVEFLESTLQKLYDSHVQRESDRVNMEDLSDLA